MKKLLIYGMMLFFVIFLVSCSGITTPTTVPDDGGMDEYDPQFISLLNELNTPLKLMDYLLDNMQYKMTDVAYTPYEFYLKKEGDCGDYATFNCYVLHYNDYEVYWVYIIFANPNMHPHAIAVFEHKATDNYWWWGPIAKYGYFDVYNLVLNGVSIYPRDFNTIGDCIDDLEVSREESVESYEVYPWNFFDFKKIE